jgi:hypothetical protein
VRLQFGAEMDARPQQVDSAMAPSVARWHYGPSKPPCVKGGSGSGSAGVGGWPRVAGDVPAGVGVGSSGSGE